MAAPSGIVWGSIKGDYVRLGIYKNISNTDTKTTVTVELWVWTKYSMDEEYNTLYYDNLASAGSATTNKGSVSIQTSVATGSGWSTSNQVKVKTYTHTYTRGTSAVTRYLYAKITDVIKAGGGNASGTISASTTFTIPKLASYAVSYNANGGSGAPAAQTKWYDKNLTLSSTKPTRTGYSFQGWSTANDTSVEYAAGATYSANSAVTLYAVWKANTYSVKYNANGGSGAPSAQTKTYGVTLKLSSTIPTRTNYNFLGWATSASATTAKYAAGANYTTNSGTTLYAVWELAYVRPRITGLSAFRVSPVTDEEGNTQWITDESGTYAGVIFDYACDQTVSSIVVEWKSTNTEAQTMTIPSEALSDSVSVVIGGDISTDATYTITVTVTDASGYSEVYTSLPGTKFAIDVKAECTGIAFGKPAELDGVADFGYTIKPSEGFINIPIPENTNFNDLTTPNTYVSYDKVASTYINCPVTSGTFKLEVAGGGNEGQVQQTLIYTSKTDFRIFHRQKHSGDWAVDSDGNYIWDCIYSVAGKVLWSGNYYMTADHTASLSEPISLQPNGVVLVFARYATDSSPYAWHSFFVPKYAANGGYNSSGHTFIMATNCFSVVATKYLYIRDKEIAGNENNSATGTANGITYNNNAFTLRYVIGV